MSLQKNIYNKLKKAIIYGELSPGEKLSEIGMAKSLNSSRTPIREAFRQLQIEGYITLVPNKGAYVSKLPPEELEEIYSIVGLLEGYAAELATLKIKNSELIRLKKLQRELTVYAKKKKFRDYVDKNYEFHLLIVHISGNNSLVKTIKEFRARIFRYRLMSVTIPGCIEKYVSDHEKIINAIEKKDSVLARKYMKEHVNFVTNSLVKFLKENIGF